MKQSEIKIGGIYTDGKGNIRKISQMAPSILYSCVRVKVKFRVLQKARSNLMLGDEYWCSLKSFAGWARNETAL